DEGALLSLPAAIVVLLDRCLEEVVERIVHTRIEDSMKALLLLIALVHASPPAGLKGAREHARAGRYDQAIAAARAAGGAAGLTLVGQIERQLGRFADAKQTFEEVAKRWPDAGSLRARLELGLTALDVGDKDRATALLDRFYQDYNGGRIDKNDPQ